MGRQSILTKDFTGEYSRFDAWLYETVFSGAILEMVRAELEALCGRLPPGARVLDVGCGGGRTARFMASLREDLRISGLDLCPPQIARARRAAEPVAARIDFTVGSALALPFASAQFDAVLSVAAIKHWPTPERGLEECVRVLKPGGTVLIAEVDRGAYFEDVKRLVASSRTPRALRPLALPLLRTFVMGKGCDLDDFRGLLRDVKLDEPRVARVPLHPGVLLSGRLPATACDAAE